MFGCYDTYLSNFERAQRTYNQMLKHRSFREFIERTQHSMKGVGNAGLRELMVEPLQRIPRYQLLIGNLLKHLPSTSPQVQRLQDASSAATLIASRRVTDGERLAAVLWSCQRTIDRFPPELVSLHRELLGCIDVDELTADTTQSKAFYTLGSVLGRRTRSSFALLIFTDALVLIQRHSSTPTHILLGVHEPDRLAEMMRSAQIGPHQNSRRTELSFAGMASLLDVSASGQGSQFTLEFKRPLRGAQNRVLTRHFVDAMPDAQSSHIPLFLDCLWQSQVIYRARGHALAARTNVTDSSKGPLSLFWTLFTRSQYDRFKSRDRLLIMLGSLDYSSRDAMARSSELFVNVELQEDVDECIAYLSRAWGAQTRQVTTPLTDLPRICADLLVLTTLPSTKPVVVPVEVSPNKPVRRAQSLHTERRNVPNVHRARSLMSERVRASIHESLEAVQKSECQELQLGRKRSVPLADLSNMSPKRRVLPSEAGGSENVPIPVQEAMPQAEPMDEQGTPNKRGPAQLSMYADDTLDLPNPFDERGAMPSSSPILPEPTKMEEPVAEILHEAVLDEPMHDVPGEQLPPESAVEPTHVHEEPNPSVSTQKPELEEEHVPFSLPEQEQAAPDAEPKAEPGQETMPVAGDNLLPDPTVGESASEPIPTNNSVADESQAPPPPPKELSKLKAPSVSEKEMHDMLRPLLEHIQVTPSHQPVVVHAKRGEVAESRRAEIVVPQPLDISQHQLETLPEERSGDDILYVPPTSETTDLATMKHAITSLNERILSLRRFRPSAQTPEWPDEWNAFKQAVKHLNVSWTKMERAYENNQMELASLRLTQPEYDTRVHLSQEEYSDLQNQCNMVLPLRLQVEKLTEQSESLKELERDTRLENAELYNVRK